MLEAVNRRAQLDALFHPRSLAMIGATRSATKWGFIVLARIINNGYRGWAF
jgi:acyl-CoA synthetase (NDP forming)